MHHLWRPHSSGSVAMPLGVQLRRYRRKREVPSFGLFSPQLTHTANEGAFRGVMAVGLHAFDSFSTGALAASSGKPSNNAKPMVCTAVINIPNRHNGSRAARPSGSGSHLVSHVRGFMTVHLMPLRRYKRGAPADPPRAPT